MCLINVAPAGTDKKSKLFLEAIKRGFDTNGDGVGIAYKGINQEGIHIRKKIMTYKEFIDYYMTLNLPAASEVIIHHRMGTSGGRNDSNCHPFVCDAFDIKMTSGYTDAPIMAHNGIFSEYSFSGSKHSDTYHFIEEYLLKEKAPNGYMSLLDYIYTDPAFAYKDHLSILSGNKLAFMFPKKGRAISLLGTFIKDGDYYFSNYSYKSYLFDKGGSSFKNNIAIDEELEEDLDTPFIDSLIGIGQQPLRIPQLFDYRDNQSDEEEEETHEPVVKTRFSPIIPKDFEETLKKEIEEEEKKKMAASKMGPISTIKSYSDINEENAYDQEKREIDFTKKKSKESENTYLIPDKYYTIDSIHKLATTGVQPLAETHKIFPQGILILPTIENYSEFFLVAARTDAYHKKGDIVQLNNPPFDDKVLKNNLICNVNTYEEKLTWNPLQHFDRYYILPRPELAYYYKDYMKLIKTFNFSRSALKKFQKLYDKNKQIINVKGYGGVYREAIDLFIKQCELIVDIKKEVQRTNNHEFLQEEIDFINGISVASKVNRIMSLVH